MKWLLICDWFLYADVVPSPTVRKPNVTLKYLTDLNNNQ